MTLVKDKNSTYFQLFDPYADDDNVNLYLLKFITFNNFYLFKVVKGKTKDKVKNNSTGSWMNFRNLDAALEYSSKKFATAKEDQPMPFKVYQICILEKKDIKALKAGYFLLSPSLSSPKSCKLILISISR